MLSGSQDSITQHQLSRDPSSRSITKEKHTDMQEGAEGVEMQQMGARGRWSVGELSDPCLPREKPRKGSSKLPLASVLREGLECGRFVCEKCPQGRQG